MRAPLRAVLVICAALSIIVSSVTAADVVDPWIAGYLGGLLVGGITALAAPT